MTAPPFTKANYADVKALAVGVAPGPRVGTTMVLHAGLLYRNKAGQIEFAEVQKDRRLVTSKPHPFVFWVTPKLPHERLRTIASWLRAIIQKNQGVRYGFAHSEQTKFVDGTLVLDPHQVGLSCSTFVATVFGTANRPLIDWPTWPVPNEIDLAFRDWMLGVLKSAKNADPVYLERLANERNGPRLRGEEIAAAAAQYPGPQKHLEVAKLAEHCSEIVGGVELEFHLWLKANRPPVVAVPVSGADPPPEPSAVPAGGADPPREPSGPG